FLLPHTKRGIWCPGFISNALFGAFAAFASWALYGSGAGVNLANLSERSELSLHFSALAGAFIVGVAGPKWITNESDKMLLKESLRFAHKRKLSPEECDQLVQGSARQVLERVEQG